MGVKLMDKVKAYTAFWNGFGLKAYDETSVPDNSVMPYITFEMMEDDFDNSLALTASIWYRSTSWTESVEKANEIRNAIGKGGKIVPYDGGAFWIKKGRPWAQHMAEDNDDSVRRTIINIEVEFID